MLSKLEKQIRCKTSNEPRYNHVDDVFNGSICRLDYLIQKIA
ncbi:MAG: hypothetical protein SRB1_01058 [Desulfobacteraceae bacterium Eth-SRB1]|nr:MAG: hypothetical protein SRB1_01058 [Desulfobacteraceae bacterium Eth-SRB1]